MMNKECGNCKHWQQWSAAREQAHWARLAGKADNHYCGLHIGDCDKIAKGESWCDGDEEYEYDGYSFEDENYDDCFGCFETREGDED